MKKVIIAGSRTFDDYKLLEKTLDALYPEPVEIVCGGAHGADNMGRLWAIKKGYPVKMFIPQWQKDGKQAGFNRNVEMADFSDELIAFYNGTSKGTEHMINIMKGIGKPIKVITYEE